MARNKLIVAGAVASLVSACVAQPAYPPQPYWVEAPVTSVAPVSYQQQVPVTQQVCDPAPQGPNETGGVVGALVGGALGGLVGNQFGKGGGKTAATAVGAVGGAVAGAEVGSHTQASPNCHNVQSYTVQTVTMYDVTYQYGGQTYHTRMDHNPGPVMRIRAQ